MLRHRNDTISRYLGGGFLLTTQGKANIPEVQFEFGLDVRSGNGNVLLIQVANYFVIWFDQKFDSCK